KKNVTSLKNVPFSIDVTTSDINECSHRHTVSNLNVKNVTTPIRVKGGGDRGRIAKGLYHFPKEEYYSFLTL
ncbi:unnamed protein product, partial [Rotaria magnacalcarata]